MMEGTVDKGSMMSIEELNQHVAAKIMGWTPKPCDLEEDTYGELTVYDDGDAWCPRCKMRDHISTLEHGIIPPPRYAESMTAAWEVIQRIDEMNLNIQDRFMDALDVDKVGNDWDESGLTIKGLATLTPEMICRAALKACPD